MASQAIPLSNSDEPGSDPADSLVASLTADIEKPGLVASSTSTHPTKETAVFLQDICLQHHFIRSRDTSAIVEKPERLRAVNVGLAAAIAHLEELLAAAKDLAAALGRMNLAAQGIDSLDLSAPVSIIKSTASVDMFNHPAVKFIHGDVDGDVYLENLRVWARDSHDKILKGESEIPEGLSQGDLYRESSMYHVFLDIMVSTPPCYSLSHICERYSRRHRYGLRSS
jgi:histone deacetylase HOS3